MRWNLHGVALAGTLLASFAQSSLILPDRHAAELFRSPTRRVGLRRRDSPIPANDNVLDVTLPQPANDASGSNPLGDTQLIASLPPDASAAQTGDTGDGDQDFNYHFGPNLVLQPFAADLNGAVQDLAASSKKPLQFDISGNHKSVPAPQPGLGQCIPGKYYGQSTVSPSARARPVNRRAQLNGPRKRDTSHINKRGPSACSSSEQLVSSDSWKNTQTSAWLQNYWTAQSGSFASAPGGFISVMRGEFLGDRGATCSLYSAETCDVVFCGNPVLDATPACDRQPALNVLLSIRNIQSYFMTFLQALEDGVIGASLVKEKLATDFFQDKLQRDYSQFKFQATVVDATVGLLLPSAPLIKRITGLKFPDAVFFLPQHLLGNFKVLLLSTTNNPADDTPRVDGELGPYVEKVFTKAKSLLVEGHDQLMQGRDFAGSNLRDWMADGNFAGFPGYDVPAVAKVVTTQVVARMINALWSAQRIFILGGQPCNQDAKLGIAPAEGTVCIEGRLFSIFYWTHDPVAVDGFSHQKWGWVDNPPGMLFLGKDPYPNIDYQDVIKSSVKAWRAAGGNKYTIDFAGQRLLETLDTKGADLAIQGAAAEGTFTVPVCDISQASTNGLPYAGEILKPYGKESRPLFCGPICSNSQDATNEFFKEANLWGYEPPVRDCADRDRQWPKGSWAETQINPS